MRLRRICSPQRRRLINGARFIMWGRQRRRLWLMWLKWHARLWRSKKNRTGAQCQIESGIPQFGFRATQKFRSSSVGESTMILLEDLPKWSTGSKPIRRCAASMKSASIWCRPGALAARVERHAVVFYFEISRSNSTVILLFFCVSVRCLCYRNCAQRA